MAQNFINHRLSTRASKQFRRIASARTEIVQLANGSEARNAMWKNKPMSYKANFALLTPEARAEVYGAFLVADGMTYLFRFRDPGDYIAKKEPFETVIGTKTPAQLTKRYYFGSFYKDRRIQAIARATIVDVSDNEISGTLDTELGLFTPDSNWASPVAYWNGIHDVWVRFDSDDLDITMETVNISTTDVGLIERIAVKVSDAS